MSSIMMVRMRMVLMKMIMLMMPTVVNLIALILCRSAPVRTRLNSSLSKTVIPPASKYWLWEVVLKNIPIIPSMLPSIITPPAF